MRSCARCGHSLDWPRPLANSTPTEPADLRGLPGAELVIAGLSELACDHLTECGLIVPVAEPRLSDLGLRVPPRGEIARPINHRLNEYLEVTHTDDPCSYYNALLRRRASFIHALERTATHDSAVRPSH